MSKPNVPRLHFEGSSSPRRLRLLDVAAWEMAHQTTLEPEVVEALLAEVEKEERKGKR